MTRRAARISEIKITRLPWTHGERPHFDVRVTQFNGTVYYTTWAQQEPTEEEVREAFTEAWEFSERRQVPGWNVL